MKLSAVATLTVLSMQFLFLDEVSGQLVGEKQDAEEHSAASARGRKTPASFHDGDGGRGTRGQPSAGLQRADGGSAGAQQGRPSEVVSQTQLGVNKLADGSSEKQSPLLPPSKRRSQGLQNHLRGHGKFNTDTYSCFGIQSKTCKRPSDCDGCLGLYTCKLPRGKCDLKAVSRKTGRCNAQACQRFRVCVLQRWTYQDAGKKGNARPKPAAFLKEFLSHWKAAGFFQNRSGTSRCCRWFFPEYPEKMKI